MKICADFTGKRLCLYILTGMFVMTVCGCGPLASEEQTSTAVLTDNFSSYSSFPSTPWSVVNGNTSSWTITSVSDVFAARFNTSSSDYSCLLNGDYSDSGNASASGKIKIVSVAGTGGTYGLYLRVASDLTSYYELIFDSATEKVHICRLKSGLSSVLNSVSWSVSTSMAAYHTYKFKLYENTDGTVTLSAFVDGVSIVTATDSSPLTLGYYTGFFFSDILDGYISLYQITVP